MASPHRSRPWLRARSALRPVLLLAAFAATVCSTASTGPDEDGSEPPIVERRPIDSDFRDRDCKCR